MLTTDHTSAPLRIGVGGPVGSGKTALLEVLCKAMRDTYNLAVVTNDIYTQEDAKILTRAEALESDRIRCRDWRLPPYSYPRRCIDEFSSS